MSWTRQPAMYFQSVQHSRSAVVEKIPTRCAARHRSRREQPVKATSATFCAGRGVPCGFDVGRLERLVLQVRMDQPPPLTHLGLP
jgi:hypothetical protein